jgi:glycosyltransferase involved in cell wall biosynthesis
MSNTEHPISRIKYAIVTPVKDEIKFFPKTITSVLSQKILPLKWVIINDGSTDGTGELIRDLELKYDWIEGIHKKVDGNRKPGGEFVLEVGLKRIRLEDYDYLVRMDGDLEFNSSYFSELFNRFEINSELGIASGVCFVEINGKLVEEKHPRFHTRGPLKTYCIKCYQDIGGLENCLGWDAIDELKANMKGWKTRSFIELKIHHLKKTQENQGIFRGGKNHGIANYNAGYSSVFMILKFFRWLIKSRYRIKALGLFYGYFSSLFLFKRRPIGQELVKYVKKQQLNKILGKPSIWE